MNTLRWQIMIFFPQNIMNEIDEFPNQGDDLVPFDEEEEEKEEEESSQENANISINWKELVVLLEFLGKEDTEQYISYCNSQQFIQVANALIKSFVNFVKKLKM